MKRKNLRRAAVFMLVLCLAGCDLLGSLFPSDGGGDTSDGGGDTENLPAAPGGLAVSGAATASAISLVWDAVADVLGYRLYRAASAGGSYAKVGGDLATTGATDSGLAASTTYYYKVSAYNAAGEGTRSSGVAATTAAAGGGHDGKMYVAKIGDASYSDAGFPAIPDDARLFTYGMYVGSDNYVYGASSVPAKAYKKNAKVPPLPAAAEYFSCDPMRNGFFYYIAGTKLYECDENAATPTWSLIDSSVPANTEFFNMVQGYAFCAADDGTAKSLNFRYDTVWRNYTTIPADATAFYGCSSVEAAYAGSTGAVYHFKNAPYVFSAENVPAVPLGVRYFAYESSPYVTPLNSEAVTYVGP